MFVNIGISLTGDEIFSHLSFPLWLNTLLSIFSVIVLLLIIGEITPKTLALIYSSEFSEKVSGIVWGMRVVLAPLISLIEKSFSVVLDILGRQDSEPLSPEEYSSFIEIANSAGAFTGEESHLLEGVFSLRKKIVSSIMTPRVDIKTVSVNDSPSELNSKIQEARDIYLPVVTKDLDDAVDFLSARDFYLTPEKQRTSWRKNAVFKAHFIPESTILTKALFEMKKHKIPVALAVDEFGGVTGEIRTKDIYNEIFGRINSEFEVPDWQVRKTGDNRWIFSGQMTLSDIEDITGIKFPDSSMNTLNALFYEHQEKVPDEGSCININGVKIRALKVKNNRIVEAELSLLKKEPVKNKKTEEK
jgi:CBS domain containing-hemolysin-like protein